MIMRGEKLSNNLYKLMGDTISGGAAISTSDISNDDSAHLWHRLGHISEGAMEELHKRKLLKGLKSCKLDFCKHYVLRKQCKVSFNIMNKENHAKGILDYIHSDMWGPTLIRSYGGAFIHKRFEST